MKKSRKFLKVLSVSAIAAMMAAATVPMTAFAADKTTVTNCNVSISSSTSLDVVDAVTGFTYYKVANVYADGSAYSYTYTNEFKSAFGTEYKLEEIVAGYTSYDGVEAGDSADVQKYANKLAKYVSDNTATISGTTINGTTTTLASGYYLIIPHTEDAGLVAAPSLVLIQDETSKEFNVKTSQISLDKQIADINDKTTSIGKNADAEENKTGSVSVGDVITYDLIAQTPSYSSEVVNAIKAGKTIFETPFAIYDVPGEGLTVDTNALNLKVTIKASNESEYTDVDSSSYELVKTNIGVEGAVFAVKFNDEFIADNPNASIKVSFDATVDEDAGVGTDDENANLNKSVLKYSNEYATGKGEAEVDSEAKVYTANLKVYKYTTVTQENSDGETVQVSKGLAGAKFKLYVANVLADGTEITIPTEDYFVDTEGLVYEMVDGQRTDTICNKLAGAEQETTETNNYTITFDKIAEGKYVVVETEAPDGYKSKAPVVITITDKDATSGVYDGTFAYEGTTNGNTLNVENIKGQSLPGTGGMGTTIFTIAGLGTIVVAGAALTIYMKKRRTEEE